MKKQKIILILSFFLLFISESNAQLFQVGLQAGYVQSSLKPEVGLLRNNVFIGDGKPASGYKFGAQYSIGEPKNQNKVGWDPKYWVSLEVGFCRCGGNFSTTRNSGNGRLSLQNLSFKFYRFDLAPKFILGSKKLRFYVGPTVSKLSYGGYNTDQDKTYVSATSDFSSFFVGFEGGVGLAFNKFNMSIRHLRYLNNYGKSLRGVALDTKNSEISVVLGLTIKEKHKGAYWNSIDWDKK